MSLECTPTDAELALRIQARDESALETLYQRYQLALVHYLESIVRDETVAQDLLQETFLRAWTRAEQWNGQGAYKAWLYRIAANLALNHLRAARRHPAQPLLPEEERPADEWCEESRLFAPGWLVDTSALGPDVAAELTEERARLRRTIDGLPAEKREVFRLVHEMELSIRDAAGRLGIPEGTVKSRLHYAEKQFNAHWRSAETSDSSEPTDEGDTR